MRQLRTPATWLTMLLLAACSNSTSTSSAVLPSISGSTAGTTWFSSDPNAPASLTSPLARYTADAYQLQSFVPGDVVDISGGNFSNGAGLIHYPANGGTNQLWHFSLVDTGSKTYQIRNPAAGKCMDIAGQAITDGAAIVLNTCSDVGSQQWAAAADGNGNLAFRNANSGLCMGVANADPNAAASLVQTACSQSEAQLFKVLAKTFASGYGSTSFFTDPTNSITSLSMAMTVPPVPAAAGALFFAPGLQPVAASTSFQPIGLGVLEPVLSWGSSCAATTQPAAYSTWWVSAQYVSGGTYAGHNGCMSGSAMNVSPGDRLTLAMTLQGTTWNQTITDTNTGSSVSFALDMLGQTQTQVLFAMIQYSVSPVADTVFENVVITAANPDSGFCVPASIGLADFATQGVVSADMRTCKIARVILRAQGVPATTANQ